MHEPTQTKTEERDGLLQHDRSLTKRKEHLAAGPYMYDLGRVDAEVCCDCKNSNHDWKTLSEIYKTDTLVITSSCSLCSFFLLCAYFKYPYAQTVVHKYSILHFEFL